MVYWDVTNGLYYSTDIHPTLEGTKIFDHLNLKQGILEKWDDIIGLVGMNGDS